MKHIHIDKAIGGSNDGRQTPYMNGCPILKLVKNRLRDPVLYPQTSYPIRDRYEVECYRLETFCADECYITFWVEESMTSLTALCQMLLRYAPKEDTVTV